VITGIAWDHRRCWGPLDASSAPYCAQAGEEVRWDRRSLYSFGDGDLGDFVGEYDLVIFDHPFVGDVRKHGWLLDLRPLLAEQDMALFERDAVGASWRSYAREGGIWALPVDTAAQTGAWRCDLLERHGFALPRTIEDVVALGERGAAKGIWVAWPSVPTDLMCTLVTVAASMGLEPGHRDGDFLPRAQAGEVLAVLRLLARIAHPKSREWNPIRCLNHMAAHDDVAYVPYLFNYVNYSTGDQAHPITFGVAPAVLDGMPARTILGGAGIGISASSANPRAAFAYAMYLCSPAYQSGDYVAFGGQPGSRTAWQSEQCNQLTRGFFRNTLPVLDRAYLRPTHPGFVPFFHNASLRLAAVIHEGAPAASFIDWLNASYDQVRQPAIEGAR
jgi:multiple sugar transport system substrate-binding protein